MNKTENEECDIIGDTLRKNEEKPEKDTTEKKVSGIYKIINRVNGKYYVGSSNLIPRRWAIHRSTLNHNTHINDHLQNAWNKYGSSNFDFKIVEEILEEKLLEVEQSYLNIAKNEPHKCYNRIFVVGGGRFWENKTQHPMFGKHHTKESNKKNSESNKIAQKGSKNANYDHKIYTFYNMKTGKEFMGTRYNFYQKYKISDGNIHGMINGIKGKVSVKNWTIDKNRYFNRYKKDIVTKKIYQFDKITSKLVGIYNSASEAEGKTGYKKHMIYKICLMDRPSAYGYIWKYEKNLTDDDKNKVMEFNGHHS